MTDTLVVGIDPGAHGAIAVLDAAGELLDVFDMPATVEANGRTATNAPLLAEIDSLALMPASPSASSSAQGRPTRRLRRLPLVALAASSKGLRRARVADCVHHAASLEAARRHSARRREQRPGPHARYRPMAGEGRIVRTQGPSG